MDARGRSRRRRRRWVIALAVVVVLAGGVAWWAVDRLRTDTTPVSVDEAAAEFDERRTSTTPGTTPPTTQPSVGTPAPSDVPATIVDTTGPSTTAAEPAVDALPAEGVYRFTTNGREALSILNNPSRAYPPETPVVIQSQGCGVVVSWTPLEERTETWEMCLEDGGVRLAGYTSVHEFFDQREERVFECRPGAWLIPPPSMRSATGPTAATCAGGGLSEDRQTTVLGRPMVTVGGEEVEAVRIEVAITTSGETRGTTTRRLTLAARNAFPLVWVDDVANTTSTAVGDADYTERVRLEATSLQPE